MKRQGHERGAHALLRQTPAEPVFEPSVLAPDSGQDEQSTAGPMMMCGTVKANRDPVIRSYPQGHRAQECQLLDRDPVGFIESLPDVGTDGRRGRVEAARLPEHQGIQAGRLGERAGARRRQRRQGDLASPEAVAPLAKPLPEPAVQPGCVGAHRINPQQGRSSLNLNGVSRGRDHRPLLSPVAMAVSLRLRRAQNHPVKTAKRDRQIP